SQTRAGAKHRSRSEEGRRIARGAFRPDTLRGDRIARQPERAVPQEGRRHGIAELVARMTGSLGCAVISPAGIMERCRHAHEAPGLVEAHVKHGIEELWSLGIDRLTGKSANAKPTRANAKPTRAEVYRGPGAAGVSLAVVFK